MYVVFISAKSKFDKHRWIGWSFVPRAHGVQAASKRIFISSMDFYAFRPEHFSKFFLVTHFQEI